MSQFLIERDVLQTDDREQTKCTAASSKCRGERLWYFWRINMSGRAMPMVQVGFFVRISSIYYQCILKTVFTRIPKEPSSLEPHRTSTDGLLLFLVIKE